VHRAAHEAPCSPRSWRAVRDTRRENDEQLEDEERDGPLANFARRAPVPEQERLGAAFAAFKAEHRGNVGVNTSDKYPDGYVQAFKLDLPTADKLRPAVERPARRRRGQ
jgi:hypothetical protein